ncbi:hypothetical protein NTD80_24095 [Pseudomonas sp. 13B_2.1_Bac1]|uniref:hypothetical protein n=1 Tax=Pseudomonas sp. 13B_2.1_Bac1 TaxID=2971624 RepID=UPI0021C61FFA|nr:hypothetical protein [Pseudomonas sp. 13B_2.1_Bac1]MCU1785839.1 hypothetical protein [Pseudomonas sp. 13B_2.1_Bac1]
MKTTAAVLTASLVLTLFDPLVAQAWQLRGGGGARTFVVPHPGGGGYRPPPPHPMPTPRPMPQHPQPHPNPGPQPHPGPGPGPHPYPMPPPPPPPPPPHPDDWYHPWAAAAVVGATTATILAIGTQVSSVPPDCVSVVANGVAYQHCGPTWYQPRYVGSSVQYIVVAAPW